MLMTTSRDRNVQPFSKHVLCDGLLALRPPEPIDAATQGLTAPQRQDASNHVFAKGTEGWSLHDHTPSH
jgi:hypothetical protein